MLDAEVVQGNGVSLGTADPSLLYGSPQLASLQQVQAVPCPPATRTWFPRAHSSVVDVVAQAIGAAGYNIQQHAFVLAPGSIRLTENGDRVQVEAARLFGCYAVSNGHGIERPDRRLVVGFRSSIDQSLGYRAALGSSVTNCSNLLLSGELVVSRKHTLNGATAFRDAVLTGFSELRSLDNREAIRTDTYKQAGLADSERARSIGNFLVDCIREGVLSGSSAAKALNSWDRPSLPEFEPRTVWSGVNAVTEQFKKLQPSDAAGRGVGLTLVADKYADITADYLDFQEHQLYN